MDMAGSHVAHAAMVVGRADPLGGFLRAHERHMRIAVALGRDLGIGLVISLVSPLVGNVQLSRHVFHVDAVGGREIHQIALGALGHVEQRFRALETQLFLDLFRP